MKTGTLKELNVKPGDVVGYTTYTMKMRNKEMWAWNEMGHWGFCVAKSRETYTIISRATPDPLPHGHVTMQDGRTVDLTANRVRCDLMDPDELLAMKGHGGPYEVRGIEGWIWMHFDPAWDYHNTYRVTPKPAVSAASATETVVMTGHKFNNEWYFNSLHKDVRHTHRITLTIQDGKIIDTKTEEL